MSFSPVDAQETTRRVIAILKKISFIFDDMRTNLIRGLGIFNRFSVKLNSLPLLGAILLTVLTLSQDALAGAKKQEFFFRIHLQAGEGLNPQHVFSIALANPDQIINVKKLPELREKDISAITRLPDGLIRLDLTSSGTNLLNSFTSTNIGAIMVVVFNGRVLYAPMIDVPIRSDFLVIPNTLTDQEIALFQAFLEKQKKR